MALMLKYARRPCALDVLQKALAALAMPLSIYFTQQVIQKALDIIAGTRASPARYQPGALAGPLAGLLITILFQESGAYFNSVITIMLRRGLDYHFTGIIAEKFQTMEYRYFEDSAAADAVSRMGSEPQFKILEIYQRGVQSLSTAAALVGTAVVLAAISPLFAGVFFVFVTLQMLFSARAMKDMNTLFSNQSTRERELEYLGGLLEQKDSVFELKLFGAVPYILGKWKTINRMVLGERVGATVRAERYLAVGYALVVAWTAFAFIWLLNSLAIKNISIDMFIAVIISLTSVLALSDSLCYSFSEAARTFPIMGYYKQFMSFSDEEDAAARGGTSGGKINVPGDPEIEFKNVAFTYPGTEKEILRDVSFVIKSGQRIALAGENGAGKSTIIKLLLRLYKPDRGVITINGINLNDISRDGIRKLFSVVFQDYGFYSLTLRENVAFGNISALHDDGALRTALALGMADDLVSIGPRGLDTNLGKIEDDGIDVSGGQKQRLAIARACAGEGAFIILDEPTAAMDPSAESRLYETFSAILKSRGCVMVSHRMASARLADRIILIDKGVVRESGSHRELMELVGKDGEKSLYAEMYTKQAEWYEENSNAAG
jgi:ABC-type multidrug transport system fused ATPase/permease subunit